jgi:hypothetical protein
MSAVEFATLEEVDLRQAWAHEAHAFTPWLAANLDRLSQALGIPLELERAEAPVGRYSADILARNPQDGSAVLIENQLEFSDHTHLGQILTYLTGLEAQTVVWVAPAFREEHLSALRWLNEHTVEPFAFFAVRVRVVRIGASPFAPLFEVLERPNGWDRRLQEVAREAREASPVASRRRAFWTAYVHRFPEAAHDVAAGGGVARWRAVPRIGLVISQWLSADGVGVFVRGGRGVDGPAVRGRLVAYAAELESRLGAALGEGAYPFSKRLDLDPTDEANWPQLADWLDAEARRYAQALTDIIPLTAEES